MHKECLAFKIYSSVLCETEREREYQREGRGNRNFNIEIITSNRSIQKLITSPITTRTQIPLLKHRNVIIIPFKLAADITANFKVSFDIYMMLTFMIPYSYSHVSDIIKTLFPT